MNIRALSIVFVIIIFSGFLAYKNVENNNKEIIVTNFDECVSAGNAVIESYPEQCNNGKQNFVRNIGNELEKIDLVRINYPRPNTEIESPLRIDGEARGFWFFEGSFPVILKDSEGAVVGRGFTIAKGEWMTEEFVSFTAELIFDKPTTLEKGILILQKNNVSDIREYDDMLQIPVSFK